MRPLALLSSRFHSDERLQRDFFAFPMDLVRRKFEQVNLTCSQPTVVVVVRTHRRSIRFLSHFQRTFQQLKMHLCWTQGRSMHRRWHVVLHWTEESITKQKKKMNSLVTSSFLSWTLGSAAERSVEWRSKEDYPAGRNYSLDVLGESAEIL